MNVTTAMYWSPAGAQRVTVLQDEGEKTLVQTRDGERGHVLTKMLTDFREEEVETD